MSWLTSGSGVLVEEVHPSLDCRASSTHHEPLSRSGDMYLLNGCVQEQHGAMGSHHTTEDPSDGRGKGATRLATNVCSPETSSTIPNWRRRRHDLDGSSPPSSCSSVAARLRRSFRARSDRNVDKHPRSPGSRVDGQASPPVRIVPRSRPKVPLRRSSGFAAETADVHRVRGIIRLGRPFVVGRHSDSDVLGRRKASPTHPPWSRRSAGRPRSTPKAAHTSAPSQRAYRQQLRHRHLADSEPFPLEVSLRG